MKKAFIAIALGVFLTMTVGSVYGMEVFSTPSEVISWDPQNAYNGYTTVAPLGFGGGGTTAHLIDMEGRVCHTWESNSYKLMPNGNFFSGFGQAFSEMDWDGNYVWGPWEMPDPAPLNNASHHHDSWWMQDASRGNADSYIGNIFWQATNEEVWAAGGDPEVDYTYSTAGSVMSSDKSSQQFGGGSGRSGQQDAIWIVDKETGDITWEWKFLDHTIQDRNAEWPNYVGDGMSISDYPGKNDIFWMTNDASPDGDEGVIQDWHHCNSLHYNNDLDLVCINAKHWSEFYVIDHGATIVVDDIEATRMLAAGDAGDFIYRWGNPSAYDQGDAPAFKYEGHQQMYGSHNIHWVDNDSWPGGPELQGMGNFIIYNNGCYNPNQNHSEILEINPFLDADGNNTGWFVNPPDAGYTSGNATGMGGGVTYDSTQLVWQYESNSPNSFASMHISGCQRLPNGNTIVCSGTQAHLFEVTYEGDVVWDYATPNFTNLGLRVSDSSGGTSTFRCQRYGPDYPGLAGQDLTPGATICGRSGFTPLDKINNLLGQ